MKNIFIFVSYKNVLILISGGLFMSENQVKVVKKQTIDPTLTLEDVKKQLLDKGKKEGHLSHEEIAEKLQNFDMDSDQMDEFFDQINDNDINLVNEKDSSDTDEKLNPHDLSAPPGVKINDPVRMYLKEIGRVDLLNAQARLACKQIHSYLSMGYLFMLS